MATSPTPSPGSSVSRHSPDYSDQYLSDDEENLIFKAKSPWEPPSSDTGRAGVKLFSTKLKFRTINDTSGYQSVFAIAVATFANVCFEVYLAKNKARNLTLEYYVFGIDETIKPEVVATAKSILQMYLTNTLPKLRTVELEDSKMRGKFLKNLKKEEEELSLAELRNRLRLG